MSPCAIGDYDQGGNRRLAVRELMVRVMRWFGWLLLLSFPVLLGIGISQLVRGNVDGAIPTAFSSVPLAFGIMALVSAWRVGIRQRRAKLLHTGAPGLGTIQAITDTAYSVNDNPEVRLSLRVVPEDGSAAFESAGRTTASRVDPFRVGQQVPVRYNPADRSEVAIAGPALKARIDRGDE